MIRPRGGCAGRTSGDPVQKQLRLLILEDQVADAELCQRELRRAGLRFTSQRVETRAAFEKALDEFAPDLIISDFSLPSAFDGLTALELARCKRPEVPYVFVSGTIGEERAVEAMKGGATDYVLKDRLNRLVPVITRAVREAEERAIRRATEAQLEETRSRLDSIVASLADVVWSVSPEPYRTLFVNSAFEALWKRPAAELYLNPDLWLESVHPQDRGRVERDWRRALSEAEPLDIEYRIVRGDGEIRWIHDRGRAVRDASGKVLRLDGLATDITERRLHEQRIARLSRVQSMLSGVNSMIVRVKDKAELFEEACRIAVRHGGFLFAWIGERDRESFEVRPRAWHGVEEDFFKLVPPSLSENGGKPCGMVSAALRTKNTAIANDVANDPRVAYPAEALKRGTRSIAVLPLLADGEAVGSFSLHAAEAGYFDEDEIKLVEELAGNISFAIDHLVKAERLDYLAYYDGLTGLPNRALFETCAGQLIHASAASRQGVAVAALDLVRFANVNETLGIAAGDAVLKAVAGRLAAAVQEPNVIARIGADCFAIVFGNVRSEAEVAHALRERVLGAFEGHFTVSGQELRLGARAGIAVYPNDGADAAALFLNAEAARTNAKHAGERYRFYAPQMNAHVAEKLKLETLLALAMREEQFVLHYQPRIELATGRLSGAEALIRWAHPEGRIVSPAEFIPVLEETGMILEIGRWTLERAAADHAAWRAKGLEPPRIGVNVSAIQLRQDDFVEGVKLAMAAVSGRAECIELEITESMIMDDIEGNIRKLSELRAANVQIAIDDFGTGYSSLSYLTKLPISILKIDRTFVSQMSKNPEHMAIVSTVISLAHSLKLKVVAEGVETEEQANLLRLLRCDEAQGYFFGRPIPAAEVETRFAR